MSDTPRTDALQADPDLAPWSELRTGGRFEEWLIDFDKALEVKT